jgi:hypothetical protein
MQAWIEMKARGNLRIKKSILASLINPLRTWWGLMYVVTAVLIYYVHSPIWLCALWMVPSLVALVVANKDYWLGYGGPRVDVAAKCVIVKYRFGRMIGGKRVDGNSLSLREVDNAQVLPDWRFPYTLVSWMGDWIGNLLPAYILIIKTGQGDVSFWFDQVPRPVTTARRIKYMAEVCADASEAKKTILAEEHRTVVDQRTRLLMQQVGDDPVDQAQAAANAAAPQGGPDGD